MRPYYANLILFSLIASAAIGCGNGKGLIPVNGTLLIDGKAPEGAVLLFFPESSEASVSTGNTDASGKYQLRTDGEVGAVPGKYTVTISWPDPNVQVTPAQKMAGLIPDPPDLLKGKYSLKANSKIQVNIESTTKELEPIQIKSK